MANALYPTFKEALLNKEHDLNTDTIKATLIDTDSETYASTDNSYTQGANGIADAAKIAASAALGSPTIALGVFDTADFTWSSVGTITLDEGAAEAIILWNDTHATKGLIAWYDSDMTGMPVTPSGGDINVTVNGSGWFAL